MPLTDQLVVPVAVPLPPRLLLHVTCVTPTLSDALPPMVRGLVFVVNVELEVGAVIVTVGRCLSAPAAIHGQPRRMKLAAIKSTIPGYRRRDTISRQGRSSRSCGIDSSCGMDTRESPRGRSRPASINM